MEDTKKVNAYGRTQVDKPKWLVIACEVMYRDVCRAAARTKNVVDMRFVRQGLHSVGKEIMPQELQKELDKVDPEQYDAILLGYGLCNYGIRGLSAKVPMVVPRGHDCITFFMGSKEWYRQYFAENPGTFYYSSGWLERDSEKSTLTESGGEGRRGAYEHYVEQFGEEAAAFLDAALGDPMAEYRKLAYIMTSPEDHDERFTSEARQIAERREWEYEELDGSPRIFDHMLSGDWNEAEFLIVPPGETIEPTYDEMLIKSVAPRGV